MQKIRLLSCFPVTNKLTARLHGSFPVLLIGEVFVAGLVHVHCERYPRQASLLTARPCSRSGPSHIPRPRCARCATCKQSTARPFSLSLASRTRTVVWQQQQQQSYGMLECQPTLLAACSPLEDEGVYNVPLTSLAPAHCALQATIASRGLLRLRDGPVVRQRTRMNIEPHVQRSMRMCL